MRNVAPRVLLLFLALAFRSSCTCCFAADGTPIFWLADYNLARQQGIEQHRPVLLFVTTDGCVYCERMLDQVFKDEKVQADLNSNFVPAMLKLNASAELAQQLKITIYPTTVIISPDGKILDYVRGYLSTDQFQARMADASAPQDQRVASIAGESRHE